MKWRVLALALLLLSLTVAVKAQEVPQVEVFGGYSYLRVNPGHSLPSVNSNGWNASVLGNINRWFGVKADFDGHYGNVFGVNGNIHNFLFGPQFSIPTGKFKPFVHGLVGPSHGSASGVSDTVLGYAVGGGLDYNVHQRFSLRIAQVDYVGTQYANNTQHNLRVSTGIVFRLGNK